MINEKNLKSNSERTPKERKELASKAGKASGVARREKKTLREAAEKLLNSSYEQEGKKLSGYDLVAASLFQRAVEKDVAAFNALRDLIGEKPVSKMAITADEESVKKMDEFFNFLSKGGSNEC